MDRFKDLLVELKNTEDLPGVSVLDNTAIMTVTDVNQGYYHGLQDMPILVAGRAGGLRSGNLYRYAGEQSGRTMLTLMKAVGSSAVRFGTGNMLVDPTLRRDARLESRTAALVEAGLGRRRGVGPSAEGIGERDAEADVRALRRPRPRRGRPR